MFSIFTKKSSKKNQICSIKTVIEWIKSETKKKEKRKNKKKRIKVNPSG